VFVALLCHRGVDMASRAAVLTVFCAACAIPAAYAAGPVWDDVVKAANAEGEVDVHGGPGKLYEEALTEGFRQAFPQIKVNFSGLSGRDAIPKIVREREAGIYNWDVYVGGTSSLLHNLKPVGAFAPLRSAFILPEVLDDAAWLDGLDSGWIDKEKTDIFAFEAMITPVMLVNWDFVSHDDLKTLDDLFKSQFSGKIVWDDPRLPGQGIGAAQRLFINFGADWLKRLFSKQSIVYIANPRRGAEWLVGGQYPIGIGASTEEVQVFQDQGLGKNIAPFDAPLPHPTLDYAFGTVSMMDKAPHPNAAKVYINWLLSKAGQRDWGKTGHDSRRLDVPIAVPEFAPKPGLTYVAEQSEENLPSRDQATALAKQFIGTQP
jgi:iron(III) transport system substrate-binding protein